MLSTSCKWFVLTINLKKTLAMYQLVSWKTPACPKTYIDGKLLEDIATSLYLFFSLSLYIYIYIYIYIERERERERER